MLETALSFHCRHWHPVINGYFMSDTIPHCYEIARFQNLRHATIHILTHDDTDVDTRRYICWDTTIHMLAQDDTYVDTRRYICWHTTIHMLTHDMLTKIKRVYAGW